MTASTSGGNWKDLLKAAEAGDLAAARYHLRGRDGVDPNYQHPEYFTAPLFEAIRNGHLDMVKLLVQGHDESIQKGNDGPARLQTLANPQLVEELTGLTPVKLALAEQQHDIVDYLNTQLPPDGRWHPKHVLVTGGNRGIGKAIVERLLREGHAVAFTCRNESTGKAVVQELVQTTGNTKLQAIVGDVNTIASTRRLAESIRTEFPNLQVLIHNAAVWPTECQINPDLLEQSFMVNYMAPYLLTQMLLPTMIQTAKNSPSSTSQCSKQVRIVLVSAGLAIHGRADVNKTPFGKDFSRFKTYQNTKQCAVIWCMHQARLQHLKMQQEQQKDEPISISFNAVHPGVINTSLGEGNHSRLIGCLLKLIKKLFKSPAEGAVAPVWFAVSPDAQHLQGEFYMEMKRYDLATAAHGGGPACMINPAVQEQWAQWTEDFLARHDRSTN